MADGSGGDVYNGAMHHRLAVSMGLSSVVAAALVAANLSACAGASSNDDGSSSQSSTSANGGNSSASGGDDGSGGTGGAGGSAGSGFGGFSPAGSGGGDGVFAAVEVVITADNAYGFGYGDGSSMFNYFGGVEAMTAGQIFNCNGGPENYVVPAADAAAGNYLYVVAYADKSTSQGVLGQFRREGGGDTVYTGTVDWEVCASGQDYVPGSGGPTLGTINTVIPSCTWYDSVGDANGKMQIGEDNTTPRQQPVIGNEFPITCGIDDNARWMWFNWDPVNIDWPNTASPFLWPGGQGNPDGQFLIFRLGAEVVPPIPN